MKLQLKKKKQAVAAPSWHPDFRSTQSLPDLKVIRTSFFVNVMCITAATAAVLFTAYREFSAFSLGQDIAAAEERIESARAKNAQYLKMNREFAQASQKIVEADKFVQAPFHASDLIVELGKSLPLDMDFTAVGYEGNRLVLKGTIRGASDSASARLSDYLDVLRADELLKGTFQDVSLTSMLRDPRTQGLSFEIVLKPGQKNQGQKPTKA